MKIVFFGSDDFAAVSLSTLITAGHVVAAVVTPPDRAQGRGMEVALLPVKMSALERSIPVLQPEDLHDPGFQKTLATVDADLFVVIAYGKFLPPEVLAIPRIFSVNVHASLLPQYRGAAPVNWAILHGQQRTGVTVMKMNARMDAGDLLAQEAVSISPDIDARDLRDQLADLGAACLCRTIPALQEGTCVPIPQDDQAATFAPKLTRDLGLIDWTRPVWEIHNQIRGLVPWPGAHTVFQAKRLKVLKAAVASPEAHGHGEGTVLELIPGGIVVACGAGALLVKEVQLESSKAMDARSFSIGHAVRKGMRFTFSGGEK